jgi:hypothetical protein
MSTRLLVCVSFVLALLACRAPDASAYNGTTALNYNWDSDQLTGFSATWKDWWDADSGETCDYWDWDPEFGEYCVSWTYWENWVSVRPRLYTPSGNLAAAGYARAWSYARLDLVPFSPTEYGTWTHLGDHYVEQDLYTEDGPFLYYRGTEVSYLGGTGQQASNSCGDPDLDSLIAMYRRNPNPPSGQPKVPTCSHFRNFPRSALVSRYFTWGDLNHPEDNPHNWAIVSGLMANGVDTTQDYYGDGTVITSGYRSPDVTGGGSYYHMWGRAGDQKAYWWPAGIIAEDVWTSLYNAAWSAGAEWVEPYNYNPCNCPSDSRTHVHSQWPYGF